MTNALFYTQSTSCHTGQHNKYQQQVPARRPGVTTGFSQTSKKLPCNGAKQLQSTAQGL